MEVHGKGLGRGGRGSSSRAQHLCPLGLLEDLGGEQHGKNAVAKEAKVYLRERRQKRQVKVGLQPLTEGNLGILIG